MQKELERCDMEQLNHIRDDVTSTFSQFEGVLTRNEFITFCWLIRDLARWMDIHAINLNGMYQLFYEGLRDAREEKGSALHPYEVIAGLVYQSRVYMVTHYVQQLDAEQLLKALRYHPRVIQAWCPSKLGCYYSLYSCRISNRR